MHHDTIGGHASNALQLILLVICDAGSDADVNDAALAVRRRLQAIVALELETTDPQWLHRNGRRMHRARFAVTPAGREALDEDDEQPDDGDLTTMGLAMSIGGVDASALLDHDDDSRPIVPACDRPARYLVDGEWYEVSP